MSKIEIIMAAYNGEQFLKEQVDSILANTYQDIKLVIKDDGSKDDTIKTAREYEEKYPDKVHLHVNKENKGVVANFLSGAKHAQSEYVMFSDQDDVWLPNKIELTYKKMRHMEHKYGKDTPIAVFTDTKVVDGRLNVINPSFHKASKLDITKVDLPHMLMENKLIGCTIMINQALKDKIDYLPSYARMHDWWIGLLAASFGRIGYIGQPTMLYRQHENNVVGNQSYISYVTDRVKNLKKQKETIKKTIMQAKEFGEIYGFDLPEDKNKVMQQFISLEHSNGIKKRYLLLKNGFLKSGTVRNIGLIIAI